MLVRAAVAVCLAAHAASAPWKAVGNPLRHDAVWASSLDTTLAGQPFVAYGYENFTRGGVSIQFTVWNATSSAWSPIASHVSQFAQQYDKFDFRMRNGTAYLALRIDSIGLSSVLRGRGGWDGFEGSWAIDGYVFDAEVNDRGDMRLVTSPDNATLSLLTYNHSGWDNYPASDAFGPSTTIVPPGGAAGVSVDDVQLVRGAPALDQLYAVYAINGSMAALATTMSNSSAVRHLGSCCAGSDDGATAAWGVGPLSPSGVLCIASTVAASGGQLRVSCFDPAAAAGGAWADLGAASSHTIASGLSAVAVTPTSVIAAAVDATNSSIVRVGVCTLASVQGALSCAQGWVADDVTSGGGLPVTNIVLRSAAANGTGGTYLMLTAGTQSTPGGDAVVVLMRG